MRQENLKKRKTGFGQGSNIRPTLVAEITILFAVIYHLAKESIIFRRLIFTSKYLSNINAFVYHEATDQRVHLNMRSYRFFNLKTVAIFVWLMVYIHSYYYIFPVTFTRKHIHLQMCFKKEENKSKSLMLFLLFSFQTTMFLETGIFFLTPSLRMSFIATYMLTINAISLF